MEQTGAECGLERRTVRSGRDAIDHSPGANDDLANAVAGVAARAQDADKFFGKTVILSARIAAQAKGGEILVSSLLKELTESVGDLRFGKAREVDLKGISERQRVHPVEWE